MFHAEPLKKKATYYSIKEATFRLKTDKEDAEAQRREYTNPKTGEEGVAYERVFKFLVGVIQDISFVDSALKDGTILRNLHINLGEDENGISQIVSLSVDDRYATNFMERLPNIDLTKEVRLTPYDFEKDGPRRVGISVAQRDEADNFTVTIDADFFKKSEEVNGEKKYLNLHGFPEATDDDRSDWPFYFKKVNKFLIAYTKENIVPKLQGVAVRPPTSYEEQIERDPLADQFKKTSVNAADLIGDDFP